MSVCGCVIWGIGCGASEEVNIHAVGRLDYKGRVERIETLGRYSSLEAALLLQLAGAPGSVTTENDYYLYRVTYPTAGVNGELTAASGLIGLPTTPDIKGIVGWQHGTNTYRAGSLSTPSVEEGLGLTALFAGDGFIMAAADYIGLGVSTEFHPYYHWPTTVSAVVDLLSIAGIMLDGIATNSDRDLYLAGFSQGGGATAAIQKSLEEENRTGLRLRAAAAIAGAFNVRDISLHHVLKTDNVLHFGFILAAYSHVYGESLRGVVQKPYDDQLKDWFDGTHDSAFFDEHLPKRVENFLTPRFLRDYKAGLEEPQWLYDALAASDTYDYSPRAPLRIHFGSEDNIVVPEEATAAFAHMRALGGNAELVDVGPYSHDESLLRSLPSIQQWFDEIEGRTK